MKKLFKYIVMVLSPILISCEDVIEVDLETAEPRLVIDASIDWIKNTSGNEQKIILTKTTGYYSETFPPVSGAEITVTNSGNTVFYFTENPGTGEYICIDFVPVIGETYTLNVFVEGEAYTATESLVGVPEIEENIEQNNTGGMAGDEVEITYYYQDDGSQENYYLYSVTNSSHVAFPQYSIENDENSQGNLTPVYYSHEDLEVGDVLNLRLYGISKNYYKYFRKILNASGNDDSPFSTTPAEVRGNINNQTDALNFPYGYFRLSEVAVKDYTIQ